MKARLPNPDFWREQRVLLTGHTGFKGAWASLWLERLGAQLCGFALAPDQQPSLYRNLHLAPPVSSILADLSDRGALEAAVASFRPTLVLHMAAQTLVRRSYRDPVETFAANVMGTVNVLEAVRNQKALRAVLVVTTDKVYANLGDGRRFAEGDRLGGHDPYSASKACAELVTAAYRSSFFHGTQAAVATARAGNVVGGGDWSEDRIVPDIWRAIHAGESIELRYPGATRPWQHVLDPLCGYFCFLEDLVTKPSDIPSSLNFGPDAIDDEITVSEVVDIVSRNLGQNLQQTSAPTGQPSEMAKLALDAGAARLALGWTPRLEARTALRWTADWYRDYDADFEARAITHAQITAYEDL